MLSRRCFNKILACCSIAPQVFANAQSKAVVLSSADDAQGNHYCVGISLAGEELFRHKLAYRGHGLATNATLNHAVIFARRPGTRASVLDSAHGEIIKQITCPDNRHFYGHGVYSSDGQLLYTTENDYVQGQGVIGVWATQNYKRVAEFLSHGVGPHQIERAPGFNQLIVANGGIQTHPDFGRRKLNLKTMQSSLVYLDAKTGALKQEYKLADKYLSIRHLQVLNRGYIAVALQSNHQARKRGSLAALLKNGKFAELALPEKVLQETQGYAADICVDEARDLIAVTAPKGNLVLFWSIVNGGFLGKTEIHDVGGITFDLFRQALVVTNGGGGFFQLNAKPELSVGYQGNQFSVTGIKQINLHWDNHMALI